jgi:FkbM family methyltransferase
MIYTIAEHSVDFDLLRENSNILDLGCRGFEFASHFIKKHNVICFDIGDFEGEYIRAAITDRIGECGIIQSTDLQAWRIGPGNDIACMTIESILKEADFEIFDLIKIDIEGSEYEVIMSLTKAPATQLSIEFHLHTGIYGMSEMDEMVEKLESLGYQAAKHELTTEHGAGYNYWDSLFILK